MKKVAIVTISILIIGAVVTYWLFSRDIDRLAFVTTLFSGAEQYENFPRMVEMFPVLEMKPAEVPHQIPEGSVISLPSSFNYQGDRLETASFLQETDTSALLVMKDGRIRFEEYWLTGGRDVHWLSMSVAKSFVSAAIGIAVEDGHIKDIKEPISDYVPSLKSSAYDGVRIKDVLQMSSGARWNEDYGDPDSDINRLGRIMAVGGSLAEFTGTLVRERPPGTYSSYNSTDTQALGLLLTESTGRSITNYMEEKLWQPLGMEAPGYWMLDSHGMEMVFFGLNATARDYAKLGELFRNGGEFDGKQIVPQSWVKASVTPDGPHLLPGDNPQSSFPLGYGYQWWLTDGDEGEYAAIGVYNQFIYVNPAHGVVIVKLSANSNYATGEDGAADNELDTIELFRAITQKVAAADASQS